MSRRGFSLVEMLVSIVAVTLVLDVGGTMLVSMRRSAQADGQAPVLVDLACDRLRRELVTPARVEGTTLVTAQARWQLDGKILKRNGVTLCRIDSATWTLTAGKLTVHLQPPHLPAREIVACQ